MRVSFGKTASMKVKAVVGIDPGATTGIAVKTFQIDAPMTGKWLSVDSLEMWQAFDYCRELSQLYDCVFIFEDARQRKWYGQHEQQLYRKYNGGMHMTPVERKIYRGLLMGAGDVTGACRNWEEFLTGNGFKFVMQPPKKGATKVDAPFFKRLTGWAGRTNEHSRDAGMIIQGITRNGMSLLLK